MKKPHKQKPKARHARRAPAVAVAHTSRRQTPLAERRHLAQPPRRLEPTTLYRPPHALAIGSVDDRRTFRLLLAPFVAVVLLLAIAPSLLPTLKDLIAATPLQTAVPVHDPAVPQPSIVTQPTVARVAPAAPVARLSAAPGVLVPRSGAPAADLPPSRDPAAVVAVAPAQAPGELAAMGGRVDELGPALSRPAQVQMREVDDTVAMVQPEGASARIALPPMEPGWSCPVAYGSAAVDAARPAASGFGDGAAFGLRLAAAAAQQTQRFVIYDDKYRSIAAVMGDVPALFGVCTDVVVRAYRAVGVDLQALVRTARVGGGDANIDHRRTETLRRFFARYGQALPITTFGEDYAPGDIVTYWRPQNSGSRSHIAVVADVTGPSGRPMIIHNRGWGPQMEDALFVDRITGHYRYDGGSRPASPKPGLAAAVTKPFSVRSVATPVNAKALPQPAGAAAGGERF